MSTGTSYDHHPFAADSAIYEQDAEFYRYQDRLRWSRFQTMLTIEGAWLYTLSRVQLSSFETLGLAAFGFLLIGILCFLSLKDEIDANRHMDRLADLEKRWGQPFDSSPRLPSHDSIGDAIIYPIRGSLPAGSTLTVLLVVLVTIFNLAVVVRFWPAA